ncbi:hypothetical protein [Microbacterium resistens]
MSTPPVPPPPAPPARTPALPRRRPLMIALAVGAAVLLAATIGLGARTLQLLADAQRTPAPASPSTPTPEATTPAPDPLGPAPGYTQEPLTAQGVEVLVNSVFTVEELALTRWVSEDAFTTLYAPVRYDGDAAPSGSYYFDVTAYDAEGRILQRSPTNISWLPDQREGMLSVALQTDLPEAARFVIDQTVAEEAPAPLAGALSLQSVEVENGILRAVIASGLTQPTSQADIMIGGYADGVLFAACSIPTLEIPAGGSIEESCVFDAVGSEFVPDEGMPVVPDDAEYRVSLSLPPWS